MSRNANIRDEARQVAVKPPAVILCEPQLGENIGTAARAMANFGLTDLRIVNPRDGWPSEKARAAASRADHVIDHVQVFDSVEAAYRCGQWLAGTFLGDENAKRGYRDAYKAYKKQSDAVLESEPIPLGQRQTIRRYFELIRPQNGDSDEAGE